jgi:hypothetical protein
MFSSHRVLIVAALGLLVASTVFGAPRSQGKDSGYLFLGPHETTRTKTVKEGVTLVATHQSGVIVGDNPGSPWNHATVFAQATLVKDGQGNVLKEVVLIQTMDPDGDMTLGFLWHPAGEEGSFQFAVGTGKWEDIAGEATIFEQVRPRMDSHTMPRFEMG